MTDILTVGDLIAELSKHPADAPVLHMDLDSYETTVEVRSQPNSEYIIIGAGQWMRQTA